MFMLSICGLICCHDHETYRYCLRATGQGTRERLGETQHECVKAVNWRSAWIDHFSLFPETLNRLQWIHSIVPATVKLMEIEILVRSEASKMGFSFNLIVVCAAWSLCGAYRTSSIGAIQSKQTAVCARKAVATLGWRIVNCMNLYETVLKIWMIDMGHVHACAMYILSESCIDWRISKEQG